MLTSAAVRIIDICVASVLGKHDHCSAHEPDHGKHRSRAVLRRSLCRRPSLPPTCSSPLLVDRPMLFAQVRMLWHGCFGRRSRYLLLVRHRVGGVMGVAASASEDTAAVQWPVEGAHSCRALRRLVAGATAPAVDTRLLLAFYVLVRELRSIQARLRPTSQPFKISNFPSCQIIAYDRQLRCAS